MDPEGDQCLGQIVLAVSKFLHERGRLGELFRACASPLGHGPVALAFPAQVVAPEETCPSRLAARR